MATIDNVKSMLGITGNYLDTTLTNYITEVTEYLESSGIDSPTDGLISRGVIDLWNYGSGDGKFSDYFMQRATQMSYEEEEDDE